MLLPINLPAYYHSPLFLHDTVSVGASNPHYQVARGIRCASCCCLLLCPTAFLQGTAVLKGNFDPKSLELVLSTLQAATLLLFNEAEELSYSEVQERLNLQVGCGCAVPAASLICLSSTVSVLWCSWSPLSCGCLVCSLVDGPHWHAHMRRACGCVQG